MLFSYGNIWELFQTIIFHFPVNVVHSKLYTIAVLRRYFHYSRAQRINLKYIDFGGIFSEILCIYKKIENPDFLVSEYNPQILAFTYITKKFMHLQM